MLQIRYHPNFKGANTILFAGHQPDIELLRKFFFKWQGETVDLITALKDEKHLYLFSVKKLKLTRSPNRGSINWNEEQGEWLISQPYQEQILSLLDGLLTTGDKGHQYLDTGSGNVQVMVAKDEYSLHICPVCGFPELHEQPHGKETGGSYEICPSCGIQFGYSDEADGDPVKREEIYRTWRRNWINAGMPWNSTGISKPDKWNPDEQIRAIREP